MWYGNDDDTSMANLTGGALPAQTWHDIMEFAHRGLELKPMPGGTVQTRQPAPAPADGTIAALGPPQRPATLTRGTVDALTGIADAVATLRKSRNVSPPGPLSVASGAPAENPRAVGGRIELR